MRVLFNRLPALKQKTGIGHYTDQLFIHLRAPAGDDRINGFPGNGVGLAYQAFAKGRYLVGRGRARKHEKSVEKKSFIGLRKQAFQHLHRWGLAILEQQFRGACRGQGYDLYHEPNYLPFPSDLPTVVTLHDLSVLLHPEWHPADWVNRFERQFPKVLTQCRHFLTVSEFIRQEAIQYLGILPERITSVGLGIRSNLGPLAAETVKEILHRLHLPPRYLLYVGTIEPRKNVSQLLRAYCALPSSLRNRWPLLLVGGLGWKSTEVAQYLHEEARHRGVIHLGYLAEEHLAAVYNGARALVFPSFYEGFGLPPLEMLACGGAVLGSTAGALLENLSGQAHLLDAHDLEGWRDALVRVVTDDEWWKSLRQGAQQRGQSYTWSRCARETLGVYRSLTNPFRSTLLTFQKELPGSLRSSGVRS